VYKPRRLLYAQTHPVSRHGHGYYLEVKIEKLKERLRDQNLTITQAFATCGVTYSGHYARLFKKKSGLTPSEYREMVWRQVPLSQRARTQPN